MKLEDALRWVYRGLRSLGSSSGRVQGAPQGEAPRIPLWELPELPPQAESVFLGLTPEQVEAVKAPEKFVVVVAGPGTGKTRTLVHRAAWMILRGVPPETMVLVTFTRKAAEEMRERLKVLLGGVDGIRVGTFHSYAYELLRRARLEGTLLLNEEEGERLKLYARAWRSLGTDKDPPTDLPRLVARIDWHIAHGTELPEGVERELYEAYQALKRREGRLDYDDLIALPLQNPELFEGVGGNYLVDESQDLNVPLFRFLKAYALSIFAVGDPRQSIYGWRGSDWRIMEELLRHFPARLYHLRVNHRSAPPIVEISNVFLQGTLKNASLPDLIPAGEREGGVYCWVSPSWEEDAKVAASLAKELAERSGPSALAVIYRGKRVGRGFPLYDTLLRELGARGVPVGVGHPLRQTRSFATLLALVAYAIHPSAEMGKELLPHLPIDLKEQLKRGIPLERARALTERGQAIQTLYLALRSSPERFLDVVAGGVLDKALERPGEEALLAAEVRTLRRLFVDGLGKAETLWDIYDILVEASGQYPEGVALTTAHGAKGLEWPFVIVVGWRSGGFPSSTAPLDEEARLAYVAMTRARTELHIVGAPHSQFGVILGSELWRRE